jgi:hypothetical protein
VNVLMYPIVARDAVTFGDQSKLGPNTMARFDTSILLSAE